MKIYPNSSPLASSALFGQPLTDQLTPMISLRKSLVPRSIGQRFALAIGTGASGILIALALVNFINGSELLLNQASQEAIRQVHNEIGNWDDQIERIGMLPRVIGAIEVDSQSQVTIPLLATLLKRTTGNSVFGLYMYREDLDWHDPKSYSWVNLKSWPNAASPTHLAYDFHDPTQDWYRGAKEGKGLHVTLPYFAAGGSEINMISITKAVRDPSGKFIGVAGADVSMEEMEKMIREMDLRDFGTNRFVKNDDPKSANSTRMEKYPVQSSYLISKTGAVIIGPGIKTEKKARKPGYQHPEESMETLADHGLQLAPEHLSQILSTETGWLRVEQNGDKLICWAQSKITGWKLIRSVPYSMIIAPASHLASESLMIGGVGLFVLIGVVFFTARRISEPITSLQSVATNFERGSYDKGRDVLSRIEKRPDELGRFAKSFSAMAQEIRLREERLSEWNTNLEVTVKERTSDLAAAMSKVEKVNAAMEAELAEAAAYSRAVLPGKLTTPVTTDWVFISSSQLGGDSFGYHWIDDDTFSLYLLDVCGHGVGAALLSMSVVNVLRSSSLADTNFLDPANVLAQLNAAFPMEQHNDMYFTAWYGVYTLSNGNLRFACGGHPPAVLVAPDGTISNLTAKGTVVGAFPNPTYETASTEVTPGSRLYLFSDGTYEIDRPDSTMMTHQEFSEILKAPVTTETSKLETVVMEVRQQQQKEAFADDFSLVEFRFPDHNIPPTASSV